MSILLQQPWPQQDSAALFYPEQQQPEPIQLIQLTPWTPPPPRIQPSRHFAPRHRRIVRTPSLSTITDRRESGTYASTASSAAASSSSAASTRSLSIRSAAPSRPATAARARSSSVSSSDSTLSSDSEATLSSDLQHTPPNVTVHSASPDISLTALRRSTSLPRLSPPQPSSYTTLDEDQEEDIIADLRRRLTRFRVPQVPFSPLLPPTQEQLDLASELLVIGQDGKLVRFGSLFEHQRTIVCFIRHFWCPLCQDYMYSIMREVDPDALERARIKLVIISNGSATMIRSYRQIFHLPASIPLYTDPSRTLYNALGMTLRTLDGGPDSAKGEYIRHGQLGGFGMVVKNAIKTRMPITAKGGDVKQLGGEFILGPGRTCSYASRMRTTRGHTSITELLVKAGARPLPPSPDEWERARAAELRGISARRLDRRGGLEHLRWAGDCGLYADEPPPSATASGDPLRAVCSEQRLGAAFRSSAGADGRARTLSDPGPALVAAWLAGVRPDPDAACTEH